MSLPLYYAVIGWLRPRRHPARRGGDIEHEASGSSGKRKRNPGMARMQHRAKCEHCFWPRSSLIPASVTPYLEFYPRTHRVQLWRVCHAGMTAFCLLGLLIGDQRKQLDPSWASQFLPWEFWDRRNGHQALFGWLHSDLQNVWAVVPSCHPEP